METTDCITISANIQGSNQSILTVPLSKDESVSEVHNMLNSLLGSESPIILQIGNKEYLISKIQKLNLENIDVEKNNYCQLSKKEKTILTFLYKGYQQKQISFILNLPINTYRDNKKKLYKKMRFKSKFHLINWCDKYFNHCFDLLEY